MSNDIPMKRIHYWPVDGKWHWWWQYYSIGDDIEEIVLTILLIEVMKLVIGSIGIDPVTYYSMTGNDLMMTKRGKEMLLINIIDVIIIDWQ